MNGHSSTQSDSSPMWREQVQTILRELTPEEKLQLLEEVARSLRPPVALSPQWRGNLDRLQQEMAALPVRNPHDGFSNRDHDQVLCGVEP